MPRGEGAHTDRNRILLILQAAACILLAALLAAGAAGIYLEGSARRAEDPLAAIYTAENVSRALAAALPAFLVFLLLLILCLILGVKDPKDGHPVKAACPAGPKPEMKHKRLVQTVVVVAAAVFILAGNLNGSAWDVLIKAIHICTECIGLG